MQSRHFMLCKAKTISVYLFEITLADQWRVIVYGTRAVLTL